MPTRRGLAVIGYLLAAVPMAAFGAVYLLRTEFMPYHAEAVGRAWGELEPNLRTLILALMRVVGGAYLALAVALVLMVLIPFRRGEAWAKWAIPILALVGGIPTLVATTTVARTTPGNPPVALVGASVGLVIVGLLLSLGSGGRPAGGGGDGE